jgi:glycosyltransferase involved in cell wall biosynthesis
MTASDQRLAVIVIPAYEPAAKLVEVVEALSADGREILVVNDGSSAACAPTFTRVAGLPRVTVLAHAVNLGKGQALKTAFNHFLLNASPAAVGVVTADADGQHLPEDIRRVAQRLEQDDHTLILGSRAFSGHVPIRSRFGNVMTRGVFKLLVGRALTDTQTGLRGIPRDFLGELLQVETGRYEFELEMLIRAQQRQLAIEEVTIATVYGTFATSHFNPLRDSLRIYFVFVRFISLSIITAAIDYAAFAVVFTARHDVLTAIVTARVISASFNFIVNRSVVFRSRGNALFEAMKYVTLVIALMSISYGLITTLVTVAGMNVYLAKVIVEGTLFAASFALQNLVVFAGRRQAGTSLRNSRK